MSIANFIPAVWSASVLRNFEKASVFANCVGREYSGELASKGDTVKIPIIGAVSVRPYTRNSEISYDLVTGSTLDVKVNNCDYFGLVADDLDTVQSSPAFLAAATKSAGLELADAADKETAGVLAEGAGTKLFTTTPLTLSGTNTVSVLLSKLSTALDVKNVPRNGRWCVLPPALANALSLELIGMATPNTDNVIADGWINRCFGFDIYMSPNVPLDEADNFLVLAGVREGGTLITQINKVESFRSEKTFADVVRGLMLWQSAVIRADGVVSAAVKNTAA